MNESILSLKEIRQYLRMKGFNISANLIEYVRENPLTKSMLNAAIFSAKLSGRKTIQVRDIQNSESGGDKTLIITRRWGKSTNPVRKLVLWGWDQNTNPSFLILFGVHEFEDRQITIAKEDIKNYNNKFGKEKDFEISPGKYNVLEENVEYMGFTILRGNQGHFPSFIDLKLMKYEEYDYDYRRRKRIVRTQEYYLVNRKGLYKQYLEKRRRYYYRHTRKFDEIMPFIQINPSNRVTFPYFSKNSYKKYVSDIKENNHLFKNFNIARSPNEILNLNKSQMKYLDDLIEIFSNQNLFQRKKSLRRLIDRNPPHNIYNRILELGSSDIISGLFLELAKDSNPILKKEAIELRNSNIIWVNRNYANGVKRCISIYLNAIDSSLKEQRIKIIRDEVNSLELIPISGGQLRGKRGRGIRKMKKNMTYNEYVKSWGSLEWELLGDSIQFKSNLITNGYQLNHIRFKHLIQEAEIYRLPDVIGRLACIIDSPKFYHLLKRNKFLGYFIYIKRYLQRLIKAYANEEEKGAFVKALKIFFINYKSDDFISSYGYRVKTRYNKLLKYFISPPVKTHPRRHYYGHYYHYDKLTPSIESINFKYKRLKKAYEKRLEIWNKNIYEILDIVSNTQVVNILRFFHEILRHSPKLDEILNSISPKLLIQLSLTQYYPLSTLFYDKLEDILSKSEKFNSELMFALIESKATDYHQKALEYYQKTNGKFTTELIVRLLLLRNIQIWIDFIIERVNELDKSKVFEFITFIIKNIYNFIKKEVIIPEEIFDLLNEFSNNVINLSLKKKKELITQIIDLLLHESRVPEWLTIFFQNLIFSISYKDLIKISNQLNFDFSLQFPISNLINIFHIFKAFKKIKIPSDSEIIEILEKGTSKMVKMVTTLVENNKDQLKDRSTTLLLLFESKVAALNEIAIEVFENLYDDRYNKTLSTLIDSPEKQVHIYATQMLEKRYGDKVPRNLIIQMLEHGSSEIKAYISDKVNRIIADFSNGDRDLFLYYAKTLILLPNLKSKSKDKLYTIIPKFVLNNKDKLSEVEEILLEIGASNVIKDSERALVALAKIKKEVN